RRSSGRARTGSGRARRSSGWVRRSVGKTIPTRLGGGSLGTDPAGLQEAPTPRRTILKVGRRSTGAPRVVSQPSGGILRFLLPVEEFEDPTRSPPNFILGNESDSGNSLGEVGEVQA